MPNSTFAERLAYLRWRWAAGAIKATDLAFAQSLGVGEKWYAKWKVSERAPGGRDEHKAIGEQLGRDVADWLYDGIGTAPEPGLWTRWSLKVAESAPPYYGTAPRQEKPAAAKPAKKKPRRSAS